jgi:phosphatidylglycerol:prolipoprotein diacylglycerol transferase
MIWQNHAVAFSLFGLDVRWYGISYILGFFLVTYLGWWIFEKIKQNSDFFAGFKKLDKKKWEDLIFGIFFAGIAGGRLGEFVFYSPQVFWQNPLEIFQVWHGGMSIHGGLLGALVFTFYRTRKYKISILLIFDAIVIPLSLALGLGRITNFLNGELAGVPTGSNWGVIFPHVDNLLRHPTQLYESLGSFILAGILFFMLKKYGKLRGILTIIFLTGYGITRFIIEFWKSPDGWELLSLSTGQWLCLVMIGLAGYIFSMQKKKWN